MTLLRDLLDRAASSPMTIALSEGEDPRIVEAAVEARRLNVAQIILVGNRAKVFALLDQHDTDDLDGIDIHDPNDSPHHADFAESLHEMRKHKGMTLERAIEYVRDPLFYTAKLVRLGYADGTVGGAVATTSDFARAAFQVIGKAADAKSVSSFFIMQLPEGHASGRSALIYSDCGLVIDPDAAELASIAAASAKSCQSLLGETPRVAMLSFSTKGSAEHGHVSKVTEATELVRTANPDLAVDGELQFDAAFVPEVAAKKAPGSDVAGTANVFIFPDLNSGNIAYKITERIGGATALGPIMQGLAHPANDLSRGCSAKDILYMIAITAIQAQMNRAE